MPIEERSARELPYEVFLKEHVRGNRPVIVRDATPGWPALAKWTPQYFKERFAERRVQVSYDESMSFSDFIDGVLTSTVDKPGPYMYRLFLHEHLPEVLADLKRRN